MKPVSNQYRFMKPPQQVRRANLDNVALVPGSLLPSITRCQQIANTLPRNAVLIVLPQNSPVQKQALLAVAKMLSAEGHQVRVMPAMEVMRSAPLSTSDTVG